MRHPIEIEIDSVESFTEKLLASPDGDPKDAYITPMLIPKGQQTLNDLDVPRYKMVKCEVVYNNNEVMTVGFGNSKKQAERNASIQGCQWLENYKLTHFAQIQQEQLDIEDPEEEEDDDEVME